MATIVTRSGKGSPLTNNEVDANFTNLNTDKAELSGATFTGEIVANAGIALGDNDKATFGAGDDLQIYHDGSNSYIRDVGTGNLRIQGDHVQVMNSAGTENTMFAISDGGVYLYHNNALKLETRSTGIDVTGTATMDGLTVNSGGSNLVATFESTDLGAGVDFTDSAGTMRIETNNGAFRLYGNTTSYPKVISAGANGDISFYEDTGTTAALFWDASAESLCLGNTAAGAKLDIRQDSGFAIRLEDNNGYYFRVAAGGATEIGGNLDVTGTVTADGVKTDHTDGFYIDNAGTTEASWTHTAATGASVINVGRSSSWGGDLTIKTDTKSRALFNHNGDISFYEDTGTTPKLFWDASAESLTIGASSGNTNVLRVVQSVDGTNSRGLSVEATTGHELSVYRDANSDGAAHLRNNGINTIALKGGNVGIGTSSPSHPLTIQGSGTSGNAIKIIGDSTNDSGRILWRNNGDTSVTASIDVNSSEDMLFGTGGGTERMRIDSSGNLLVGTTSTTPQDGDHGFVARANGYTIVSVDDARPMLINRATSDGELLNFRKDGTNVGSIGALSSRMYMGTGDTGLFFNDQTDQIQPWNTATNAARDAAIDLGRTDRRFKDLYLSGTANAPVVSVSPYTGLFNAGTNKIGFQINGQQKAQIDSSGNLLVGTTSTANNTDGIRLLNAGYISIAQDSNNVPCGFFNKITHDGNILEFQKDGTSVGSIGTVFGSLTAGTGATGLRFTDGDTSIRPWNLTTNAVIDNTINLGAPAGGFKDLYLSGTANAGIVSLKDGNNNGQINATTSGAKLYYNVHDAHIWQRQGSEKARIDSSGNLLVGQTSQSPNTVGVSLNSNGNISAKRDGGIVGLFNRGTSDGTIVDFRKDGTTVGSIGVDNADNLVIEGNSTHSGLQFGTNQVLPHKNGSVIDAAIDLGSPTARFNAVWLSGGVYLGGTGAANKLDDYEEGTWTPTFSPLTGDFASIAYNLQNGRYTKVGNMVTVSCQIRISSWSIGTASGILRISGLPFNSLAESSTGLASVPLNTQQSWVNAPTMGFVNGSASTVTLTSIAEGDASYTFINVSDMSLSGNSNRVRFTATYFTA